MRSGLSPDPRQQALEPGTSLAAERLYIGGYVLKKDEPQPGIQVALKDTGFVDTTDKDGRFRLGGLLEGQYTLIAWPKTGKPKEIKVSVPATKGNYDIEL